MHQKFLHAEDRAGARPAHDHGTASVLWFAASRHGFLPAEINVVDLP